MRITNELRLIERKREREREREKKNNKNMSNFIIKKNFIKSK